MKIKFMLLAGMLILLNNGAFPQNLIAVQNGDDPDFYTNLDSAIVHASNGDTVYIPGGTFNITVAVDKRLHIIGVGHDPDSTLATNRTWVNGNFNLVNEASNGSLCGIDLGSSSIISVGNISGFLIRRCRIGGLGFSSIMNWIIIENIISSIYNSNPGAGASNCFISNNFFEGGIWHSISGFNSSDFRNNIFLYQSWQYCCGDWNFPIIAINCSFENNIFISTSNTLNGVSNSSFYNNLFVEDIQFTPGADYWSANNIVAQPQSSIFVNQSGNSYVYHHDYHLKSDCPGKNAGTDGTDIGIYGGPYPWKDGSLPFNPHIQHAFVTDVYQDGNIHVNIKVSAQDH